MRVLFISNFFPPYFLGGYEVACKDIAEQFEKQGNKVSILCSSYGLNSPSSRGSIYRILTARNGLNGFKSLSDKTLSLFYNPVNYKKTLDVLMKVKPDIASVWNISGISISPLFALQKMKIPYVVHLFDRCYSFIKKRGWKKIINPFLFNRLYMEHIISCSQSLKEDYVKKGFEPDCISVFHHGIIPEKKISKREEINRDNVRLLFVGQLWEAKGVDLAIHCVALLKEHGIDASLSIVGDGRESYIKKLKKMTKETGVSGVVEFLGRVPREKLKKYYRGHDILIFPTYDWYREPFGITILEAMNQGIPVIASNCGGPKEIINDKKTGLLFEPGNVKSLTEEVILLVENSQLYNKIQKEAFSRVNNQFDIKIVGRNTVKYYESFLGNL